MHALVFAAGRGTRLRPYTDDTPKPLLPVAGEPLLTRCLRPVVRAGVEGITIVVGYRGGEIRERFGDSFEGVPVGYARQEPREGLAHAALAGEDRVPAGADVLAVNGDNVFDCSLSPLVDRHREPDVDGTLLLDRSSRNEAETAAFCELADDGTVRSLEAAAGDTGTGYVAGGAGTHTAELFDACRAVGRAESGEYELAAALETLVRGRHYVGVELAGFHLNVNTPADLERARERFAGSVTERGTDGSRGR